MDRSTAFSREFGWRVREQRMALGMAQHALGDQLGIPQGHVSRMEKGEFIFMYMERLVELANVLHTSVDYLLGRTDKRPALPVTPAPDPCSMGHPFYRQWCVHCRDKFQRDRDEGSIGAAEPVGVGI